MVELYYRLVSRGLRTLDSIKDPVIRKEVEKKIKEAENGSK